MYCFFFFKQKTAYDMRISDWSSDVCSSDLQNRKSALYFSVTQILTQYNTRAFWESEVRSPTVKQGKRNWPNGQCAVWCVTAMPSQGDLRSLGFRGGSGAGAASNRTLAPRSEEHTSELQSLMRISYAVFCLQ